MLIVMLATLASLVGVAAPGSAAPVSVNANDGNKVHRGQQGRRAGVPGAQRQLVRAQRLRVGWQNPRRITNLTSWLFVEVKANGVATDWK